MFTHIYSLISYRSYVTVKQIRNHTLGVLQKRSFVVGITFTLWKCLCVKYLKKYLTKQHFFFFFFGASLLSNIGQETIRFGGKFRWGKGGCGCRVRTFGIMVRERRKGKVKNQGHSDFEALYLEI